MPRKSISRGPNRGIRYEESINSILKEKNLQLDTTESAGASDSPDGFFWYNGIRYPLEIKRGNADFAQVELRWVPKDGFFYSKNSKNRDFIDYLSQKSDFLTEINNIWEDKPKKFTEPNLEEKERNWDLDHFPDIKKSIDVSYIEEFYNLKNPSVNYIQIERKGFFFLGVDIAKLGIPRINGKPYLRARVKTRSASKNKWGFLVAIKMPGIDPSKFDIEELDGRLFPIPLGDHIKGPIEKFI